MGDELKVIHSQNTDSVAKNQRFKVPRAHIEAHAKLLKEQQTIKKQFMLDKINDINRQQEELEAQLKALEKERKQQEIENKIKEFKYQVD